MSSSVYIDEKWKYNLTDGERPTQGLDDTTLTAEAKYPINFTHQEKDLYSVCTTMEATVYTIMEATVSYLLMLQKYISSKQKTQK